jgi:uncharacterized membrane protein
MNVKTSKPLSLTEFKARRKPLRDINKELSEKRTRLDRFAIFITEHIGTMGFFLIIAAWTILWLGWNLLAPKDMQFDPPMGFVFWLFISNLIQLLLMPLIMVGQNIQGRHAEQRAEYDLEVNVKAEKEIEVVLQHLEYQNNILMRMLQKLGMNLEEFLEKTETK